MLRPRPRSHFVGVIWPGSGKSRGGTAIIRIPGHIKDDTVLSTDGKPLEFLHERAWPKAAQVYAAASVTGLPVSRYVIDVVPSDGPARDRRAAGRQDDQRRATRAPLEAPVDHESVAGGRLGRGRRPSRKRRGRGGEGDEDDGGSHPTSPGTGRASSAERGVRSAEFSTIPGRGVRP